MSRTTTSQVRIERKMERAIERTEKREQQSKEESIICQYKGQHTISKLTFPFVNPLPVPKACWLECNYFLGEIHSKCASDHL